MKTLYPAAFFLLCCFSLFGQGTIINRYALALGYVPCTRLLTVDSGSYFSPGDKILVLQVKGMECDSSNTSAFGTTINANNVGNYELNEVSSIAGNVLTLRYHLIRSYNFGFGKVQAIKVPHFSTYTINTLHTCSPWNGSRGGVFAIVADDSLVLRANIDVSGKGFRQGVTDSAVYITCCADAHQTDYCFPHNKHYGAMKGEGVTEVSALRMNCRGPLYNGGGGANSHNSGGGGGGNAGKGGIGGIEWLHSPGTPLANGGLGGYNFTYTPVINKMYLGGGGGAGHQNDGQLSDGGAGGGMVLIITNKLVGNNDSIIADGLPGLSCMSYYACLDATGGGGAGGVIAINAQSASLCHISAKGGDGGDINSSANGGHGPAGGGGGGAILLDNAAILTSSTANRAGGIAGLQTGGLGSPSHWGATDGDTGVVVTGFKIVVDTITRYPGRRLDTAICLGDTINVKLGSQYGISWAWSTGQTDSTITVRDTGLYSVTLFDGVCTYYDTFHVFTIPLPAAPLVVTPINYCVGDAAAMLTAVGSGLQWYVVPGGSPLSGAPTPSTTTSGNYRWYVNQSVRGCSGPYSSIDVVVDERPIANFGYNVHMSCGMDTVFFYDSSIHAQSITWSPFAYFYPNTHQINPVVMLAAPRVTKTYAISLLAVSNYCRDSITRTITLVPTTGTINLRILTQPQTIFPGNSIQLDATGAFIYYWMPNDGSLTDPNINNPVATPSVTTVYTVFGYDEAGCRDTAEVTITVDGDHQATIPDAFTPNGDGKNDVFRITSRLGKLQQLSIYNRWGEMVFTTNDIRQGWDGTYGGVEQDMGVYNYMVIMAFPDGKTNTYSGTVTLLR